MGSAGEGEGRRPQGAQYLVRQRAWHDELCSAALSVQEKEVADMTVIAFPTWPTQGTQSEKKLGPDQRVLTDHEVSGIAAIYWPPQEVARALEVSRCESGLNTGAWAYVGEDSRGLWQLNVRAHPQLAAWNLFDPQINAYFAYHLWATQGWQPWTCAHTLGYV